MGRTCRAVSNELHKKATMCLKKLGKTNRIGWQLQAIIAVKKHGITAVSKIIGVTRTTISSWIKNFENGSLDGLRIKPGRGRKPKLSTQEKEIVQAIMTRNSQITIDQLKDELKEKHEILISRSALHRHMKRLNFSYITPRPSHYKSNKDEQDVFKKNSKNIVHNVQI